LPQYTQTTDGRDIVAYARPLVYGRLKTDDFIVLEVARATTTGRISVIRQGAAGCELVSN